MPFTNAPESLVAPQAAAARELRREHARAIDERQRYALTAESEYRLVNLELELAKACNRACSEAIAAGDQDAAEEWLGHSQLASHLSRSRAEKADRMLRFW